MCRCKVPAGLRGHDGFELHLAPMTTPAVRTPPQAPFESSVFYNLRYAGTSSADRLHWRRQNLAHLCNRHTIIGLSELRSREAVVESALLSHLPTHMRFYNCGEGLPGQAILVQRKWAATVGIGDRDRQRQDWGHEVLVQSCAHMVWWITHGVLKAIVNMYLDSHSAQQRVHQLEAMAARIRSFKQAQSTCAQFEFIFDGDRNFVTVPEHRSDSSDQTGQQALGSTARPNRSSLGALGSSDRERSGPATATRKEPRSLPRSLTDPNSAVVDHPPLVRSVH